MDRRVKYTKNTIEDTFLSLLEQKDLSNITVTEICQIADINRATFYRYYDDIYDLLKKIQESFVDDIKNSNAIINIREYTVYDFTMDILKIFLKNKKIVKILFDTNNSVYFVNDVLEVPYKKLSELWITNNPNISKEEILYSLVYVFNGALGVIDYWVKNNFDTDIEIVASYIEKITKDGIHRLLRR